MKLRTKKTLFHIFASLIIVCSVLLTAFSYEYIFSYFVELCKSLGPAFVFFGKSFVKIKGLVVPPNEAISVVFRNVDFSLDIDYTSLEWKLQNLGAVMFTRQNISLYNIYFLFYTLFFLLYVFGAFFIFQLIKIALYAYYSSPSSHPGKPTLALVLFKKWIVKPVVSSLSLVKRFFSTFWDYKAYKWLFVLIWLFNFNVINVILEFLYFYSTFLYAPSLKRLLTFILTMVLDICIGLYNAPVIVWVILFGILFVKFRKKISSSRKSLQEKRNIRRVEKMSFDVLVHAKIRAGKTKFIAYLATLMEKLFRRRAYKSIYKFKRKFPDFPWYRFFKDLDQAYEERKFKCPLTAEVYIKNKKKLYNRKPVPENIYGYIGRKYFDTTYKYSDLWDELAECAKCYFVYSIDTSLTVSSFPIRISMKKDTIGNFNKWDDDMLNRNSDDYKLGYISHNIHWDAFRTKKHMNERSKFIGSFNFGNFIVHEYDKERFNMITSEQFKGIDDRATPLNDGASILLKTIGHGSTYDFQTYYFSAADSQRTESLNADERALRDDIEIIEVEKNKLTLPFYFEGMLIRFLNKFFEDLDLELSYFGHDGCSIPAYLINHLISALFSYDFRIYKHHGYSLYRIRLAKGKGFQDELLWVPNCIAESDLYKTDALKCFYTKLAQATEYGIQDIPEFSTLDTKWQELLDQDSYSVQELFNAFKVDK